MSIVQCPNHCGRLVYRGKAGGDEDVWLNAAGAWTDFEHMCCFDGADERGDHDDSMTRAEELGA